MEKDTCILFDIDGTLVDTHGAGRDAFTRAICETLCIIDDLRHISFAGATDLNVFHTLCEKHHITSNPDREKQFFQRLEEYLTDALHRDNMVLFPGVTELLDALTAHPQIDLGLLTGNAGNCARVKLAPFNLNHYFPFGAYGNEFAVRSDIARCALQRAIERSGNPNLRMIVIGDTPLDILAAQSINATSLAVATGQYSTEELHAAGADHVLPSLADTLDILHRLTISIHS